MIDRCLQRTGDPVKNILEEVGGSILRELDPRMMLFCFPVHVRQEDSPHVERWMPLMTFFTTNHVGENVS